MKTLQRNFTTPEQSKWLLELGVSADSADCLYDNAWLKIDKDDVPLVIYKTNKFTDYDQQEYTPCWSVGRLIEIFETCTSTKFERWSHIGAIRPLLEDCIEHIEFALNPDTIIKMDFSKLEE